MIEIIPNWHPIFVHFTVALISTSVGLYVLAYIVSYFKYPVLGQEFETTSRWCLWIGSLITIVTVLAGLYAYNTVKHDAMSHMAMTNHRNWALATVTLILLTALWSLVRYRKHKNWSALFLLALLIIQSMVLATAWRGGELVYRYGLGVMSLPQAEEVGHHHQQ